ncbi:class I SAM-dependent methyltransferase [Roseospira navarrensis]|uniref:Class I SAM-dependent methyltransferase n=1 Tax=Roseospira navarrensis TaxID=140058 RepID=A0A7X1ZBZ7_9PROT|nr:class I SAM-dependent methyltransferase [Roseospira navarrensis]MQX35750.1 class I SAM-dependent methyltransferase [Roseospira navarrensis]
MVLSLDTRRTIRASQPRVILEDRHTRDCRVLPSRDHLMDHMPKDAEAAEVGVAHGDFTRVILDRARPRRLHLIDLWSGDRFESGLEAVKDAFAPRIADDSVRLHVGESVPMLDAFPDASLDWIYLDSDHSYDTTRQELEIAARVLRPGGLVAGHDYCAGNVVKPVVYGVVEAVNAFCAQYDWRFRFLTVEPNGYFSFCLQAP